MFTISKPRYYPFSLYLKERFGERVHRISLNAGFGCPNQDGSLSRQGCFYCNNLGFSYYEAKVSLEEQIRESMYRLHKFRGINKFLAYFQSYTNTYADIDTLRERYRVIEKFSNIVGLIVSTRPDCIDKEKLKLLNSFTKDYAVFIEYGLQSAHNSTLSLINRNHSFEDFLKAVELTAHYPRIKIGVHIILGLPQEDRNKVVTTAKKIKKLPLWGVKFHCLHILEGSIFKEWYEQGKIRLLEEQEYISLVIDFIEHIPPAWVILRLVSSAYKNYLIAPLWLNDKARLIREIEEELLRRNSWQGKKY